MTTFIALYHGQTVGTAQILAVSAAPALVAAVADALLENGLPGDVPDPASDPVGDALQQGRREALKIVGREAACVQA